MKASSCIRLYLSARASVVLVLALLALGAAAQGAKSAALLCAPYYGELLSKGMVTRMDDKSIPRLLPMDASSERIRAAVVADDPGILVESVFFLPRQGPANPEGRLAELAQIYGLLRSFSTLQGIQYYSASHKSMRTLYTESYRIDGPKTKIRMPDPPAPLPAELPAEETLFAFQRDLSFGANLYSYVFVSYPDTVVTEMTNLTRMSYGIIPLVAPNALKTRLLVIAASEGIIFYAESDSSSPGAFRTRLGESFANRAAALFAWFDSKSSYFLEH